MNSLQSAFKSMKRNVTMSSASILLVTLTLLVVGFVFQISTNTAKLTDNVLQSLNIYTYLDTNITKDETKEVKKEINKIEGVTAVEYSSKDDELKSLTSSMGNKSSNIEEYFSGDVNPLNDVFIVSVDSGKYDLEDISAKIGKFDHVESVDYGESSGTNNFIQMMKLVRTVSLFVAAVLVIVSVFIITNTIKLTITARKKEIEIMRLVGATKMYIRKPFMAEGLIIGACGGFISFVVLHFSYAQVFNSELFITLRSTLINVQRMDLLLIIVLPLIGMVIGTIGSAYAIRKYLQL